MRIKKGKKDRTAKITRSKGGMVTVRYLFEGVKTYKYNQGEYQESFIPADLCWGLEITSAKNIPHRCPECNGAGGDVDKDVLASMIGPINKCKECKGEGIKWVPFKN